MDERKGGIDRRESAGKKKTPPVNAQELAGEEALAQPDVVDHLYNQVISSLMFSIRKRFSSQIIKGRPDGSIA